MRKAFNFYRSYWEVLQDIENPMDRLQYLEALLDRQFTGKQPSLGGIAKIVYNGQKYSIDKSVEGYESKTGEKLTPPSQGPTQGSSEGPTQGSSEGPTQGSSEGSSEGTSDGVVMTTEGSREGPTEGPSVQEQEEEQEEEEVKEENCRTSSRISYGINSPNFPDNHVRKEADEYLDHLLQSSLNV
jgi:hypothetical protein